MCVEGGKGEVVECVGGSIGRCEEGLGREV